MVYFIYCPDDPECRVKIGYTNDSVAKRVAMLQVGCPYRLSVLMVLEGDRCMERHLQARFSPFRVQGEWFRPSEELRDFIRRTMGEGLRNSFREALANPDEITQTATKLGWTEAEVRAGLEYELTR